MADAIWRVDQQTALAVAMAQNTSVLLGLTHQEKQQIIWLISKAIQPYRTGKSLGGNGKAQRDGHSVALLAMQP